MAIRRDDSESRLVVAIPVRGDRLSTDCRVAEEFALFDIDLATKKVRRFYSLRQSHRRPGTLTNSLHDEGVEVVIAGGIPQRTKHRLIESGIYVLADVVPESAQRIIRDYLHGELRLAKSPNACCDV
jgi:predicted Fe-Mo cluster-binding NifX family protein